MPASDPAVSTVPSPVRSVRAGRMEDLPAIMEIVNGVVPIMQGLGNQQWDEVYPLEEHFAADVKDSQLWLVVEQAPEGEGEMVIAMAALTEEQSPEYADCGWDLNEPAIVMHRAAVRPSVMRGGVMSMLFAQADALSRERGFNLCRIDTNEINAAMQGVIRKNGYSFAGDIRLMAKPADMKFKCFEKRL